MSLAKQINEKLDKIIALKNEIGQIRKDLPAGAKLKNMETGDEMTREDAVACAEGVLDMVKTDLTKITNSGQNVQNIFDNPYYINDTLQDMAINAQNAEKN